MFPAGAWNIGVGGEAFVDTERSPPPKCVPLEFPTYTPPCSNGPLDNKHLKCLCEAMLSIRRPLDVQDSHLGHLNIRLKNDVDLLDVLPERQFESRPFLYDRELASMLTELGVENEDAYREILRLPPLEGRTRPRVAYARNFFQSLEDMSRYWDDSKDDYYEVERIQMDNSTPDSLGASEDKPTAVPLTDPEKEDAARLASPPPPEMPGRDHGIEAGNITASAEHSSATSEHPTSKQVYKGHRIGSGEQMNPGVRVAAVRNLLKMAIHKFNCRDYDIHPREKFSIRNINISSTFYNFCVAKIPSETKLARARMVEGPVLAVHCRSEVRFQSRDGLLGPTSDFVGEKFDLFREVAGLLMLARQRARENTPVSKLTREGQWWTTQARWGGGATRWGQLANEVYEDEDPSWSPAERALQHGKRAERDEGRSQAETLATRDVDDRTDQGKTSNSRLSMERRKRPERNWDTADLPDDKVEHRDGRRLMYTPPVRRKWYREWVKLRPNAPCWDDKVIYRRIGRQDWQGDNRGWDDVYMVSAANHHVSLVRLRVHKRYLDWLTNGGSEEPNSDSQAYQEAQGDEHHILHMSRTRWYDLFDLEQRQELMTGIWRLLCWLTREETPKEEYEKMEALKRLRTEAPGDQTAGTSTTG